MPMRATTVRFSGDLWSLLEREAAAQGVSAAQFIRDATILRVAVLAERRGDREARLSIADVAASAVGGDKPDALPGIRDPERLEAVRSTGLLDAPPEPALDRLAALAAKVVNAPVAMVSIIDEERQFFASCLGVTEPLATTRQTPLAYSFCQHAVSTREPLVVPPRASTPCCARTSRSARSAWSPTRACPSSPARATRSAPCASSTAGRARGRTTRSRCCPTSGSRSSPRSSWRSRAARRSG